MEALPLPIGLANSFRSEAAGSELLSCWYPRWARLDFRSRRMVTMAAPFLWMRQYGDDRFGSMLLKKSLVIMGE
jgi:hypothetical protein